MSRRFFVPDSSAPSTPEKTSRNGHGAFSFGSEPSTTPAGPPPPSSSGTFTPSGAPSASFLGSSVMRGVTGSKPPIFSSNFGAASGPRKNLFPQDTSLGGSIRGSKGRQPSSLSKSFSVDSGDATTTAANPSGTFGLAFDDDDDDDDEGDTELDHSRDADDIEAEIEQYLDQDMDAEGDEDGDLFLDLDNDEDHFDDNSAPESDEDLMVLTTPAADDRARQEAEDIFRASTVRQIGPGRVKEFQFDSIGRQLYQSMGPAIITETPDLLLTTDELLSHLYEEGVGKTDDAEKMDSSLSLVSSRLVQLWKDYASGLPDPEDHAAEIGPGPAAEPFRKAAYIAELLLRIHHTRSGEDQNHGKQPPLPEILFGWLRSSHNLYPDQFREVEHHRPSPVCHSLFWPTVRTTLIRGEVQSAVNLLQSAGWEHVKRGRGENLYTGRVLRNVQQAVNHACEMLEMCPGMRGDWDIWGSDWILFRVKARASLDQLTRLAEGKTQAQLGAAGADNRGSSLAGLARKAESQVPWEIYEQIMAIYDIALGDRTGILETAQDWCEATVGLCGWWDEERDRKRMARGSLAGSLSRAQPRPRPQGDYSERLAFAFHWTVESDFHFNPLNAVEVAIASAFEGNYGIVIGILRSWSLPVASATAEVASLGHWLPKPEPPNLLVMEDGLDMDDLEVLGMQKQGADELEGIKDTTLVLYARELAGIDQISTDRTGWEMALQVLGRMDSVEKSEATVGELLHDMLEAIDEHSGTTVDKIWRLLNDLGMISFAEETAEAYADILSRDSHRYGEALWFYALSHKPARVREILNLLLSYSLIQSTAYPPASDLDDHLYKLLTDRSSTLEAYAKQDIEAAQLLGKALSGYATLRKFYDTRDEVGSGNDASSVRGLSRRRQAATALVAVIASSDDNIRGGLYDASRDAVVSEDFLLALLGESMVLVNQSPPVINLEQMDTLLKAIEDLETVGSRVFDACEEFFQLVLASTSGLKGSTPADLLKKSTSSLSGSSYVMTGSSMLASQLHRSISGSSAGLGRTAVPRGWDWRTGLQAQSSAKDVLRILRLGLSRDLAALWLQGADNVAVF